MIHKKRAGLVSDANSFVPGARLDHFFYMLSRLRFALARSRQRTVHREVVSARNQKFFGREARDDFVARRSDHDLFFNASGAPSVRRRPERLQRENHSRLDLTGMVERHESADDWLLPDREANAVAILQSESRFFVRESEVCRFRPYRRDFRGRASRAYQLDRS